jgi:H+/Cl- antiporter ClcA
LLNGTSTATAYDPLIKILATAITLSFAGSGGIVTPIFFVGTATGSFLAPFFGMDPATGAAVGMVAMLAGCANTPIAASVMAIELFGAALSPYAAVACIVSFLMVGHRSVYPSQILAMVKSASLRSDTGKPLEETAEAEYAGRTHSVVRQGELLLKNVRRRRPKK